MTTDIIGARDEMFGLVNTAWIAAKSAVLTSAERSAALARWQGKIEDEPAGGVYWIRSSMIAVAEGQANLGGTGEKRRRAVGNLFVQVFAPVGNADADAKMLAIGKAIKNSLARPNSSGTVWLRFSRINTLQPEGKFHRLNVVADYEYDELV